MYLYGLCFEVLLFFPCLSISVAVILAKTPCEKYCNFFFFLVSLLCMAVILVGM